MKYHRMRELLFKVNCREFSGCPVVRTLSFPCRGLGSSPGCETKIPQASQSSQNKHTNKVNCGALWASQVTLGVKNLPANAGDIRDAGSIPGSGTSLEEGMAAHSSILSRKSHGQKSLLGYSPWGRKASDTTEAT